MRTIQLFVALLVITIGLGGLPAAAQNPITAAREAFRKSMEEQKRKQEEQKKQQEEQQKQRQGQAQGAAGPTNVQSPPATQGDIGTAAATARIAAAAGFVDVIGIKLGMPVKDAWAALKAHNPKMTVPAVPQRLRFDTYWPGLQLPYVDFLGNVGGGYTDPSGSGGEQIMLGVTMPPNVETVWYIQRQMDYEGDARPTVANTIAALRQKYGPESGTTPTNPAMLSTYGVDMLDAYWVYDAKRQRLPAQEAAAFAKACGAGDMFAPGGGRSDVGSLGRPTDPNHWLGAGNTNCGNNTVVTAMWRPTNGPGETKGLIQMLVVRAGNGLLYRSAFEATAAMLRQADQERRNQEQKNATQVKPKL